MAFRNTYRDKCLQVLGLSEGASGDEIGRTFRKLARQFHPDKNPDKHATKIFQEISCAYNYLLEAPIVREYPKEGGFRIPFELLIIGRLCQWLLGALKSAKILCTKIWDSLHFKFGYDDSRYDERNQSFNSQWTKSDSRYRPNAWNQSFNSKWTKTTFSRSKERKKQVHQQQKEAKTQTTSTKKLKRKMQRERKTSYDRSSSHQFAQEEEKEKRETMNSKYSSSKVPDSSNDIRTENKSENCSYSTAGHAQKTDKKQKKKLETEQRRHEKKTGKKQKKKLQKEQRTREKEMEEIAEQYMKQKENENKKVENSKLEDKTTVVKENGEKGKPKNTADTKFENHALNIKYLMEETKRSKTARKNERKTSYDRSSSHQFAQEEEKAKPDTMNSSSKVPDSSNDIRTENKSENYSYSTAGHAQKTDKKLKEKLLETEQRGHEKKTGKKQKKKLQTEQRTREKEMEEITEQYMKQKENENKKVENSNLEDKTTVVKENGEKGEPKSTADTKFENHALNIKYLMEKKRSKTARKNERRKQAVESAVYGRSIYGKTADINSTSEKMTTNLNPDFHTVESTEYWTKLTESTYDFWKDIDKKIGRKTTKDFGVDIVYASLGQLDLNDGEA